MIISPEPAVSRPPRILSSVVLPEPDGPRTATNSLSLNVTDTPSSAFWMKSPVLYSFLSSLTSIMYISYIKRASANRSPDKPYGLSP